MLGYADHPTPPFNSPYQHHTSRPTLLESPYPSPNRIEPGSKFPDSLGLYNYQQPLPVCLPPSPPQSSPAWVGHLSSGTSSVSLEAIADPWTSGAFEHPVSQSPQPWSSAHTSPRSSLSSSTRDMSVFSHDDSESSYSGMRIGSTSWATDARYNSEGSSQMNNMQFSQQHPLTAMISRMDTGAYQYSSAYTPASMTSLEPTPALSYRFHDYERTPSEKSVKIPRSKSRSKYITTSVPRERSRNPRHTDPAKATFRCETCPNKGFARRYNFTQHMLTHQPYRKKDHVCPDPSCSKAFTRKTDLVRHNLSVHVQSKEFKCLNCPKDFSRKDTLRRHEEDGCTRRFQVQVEDPVMLARLRSDAYSANGGL
ncbi:hypothetical protein P153DRAFT_316725 [Dothidotthia symphoricarpi CBS 119687]|uniref:C2H2-type domain-containing protein n=1 Tax=Dothidotthia symphoricarpi CBS 119687 TaxID=1392245 RepID=A0A6A6AEZ4_9PLEO|nr:uncharacterized protein P153DRAFT_316725 [Dothidotthia symphoricarpi CBS 119687]KAF2129598.1 hypothetical protein P153DRAFT_316725 [Dothidotthia symphoricarpi CBS 119687]